MAGRRLWQGIIMEKRIQEMAEVSGEIQQNRNKYTIEDIPEIAQRILDKLDIKEAPVPIVAIMKSLKFQVVSADMEDEISGVIGIDDELNRNFISSKVIAVNNKDSFGHQRFTMAHELAHYLFDFDVSRRIVYYNAYNTKEVESEEEHRANFFAANLLMPEKLFREEFPKALVRNNLYLTVEKLSDIFQVSREAVRRRLLELSLEV
ncbi:MAG: ImmA/IrrE family metallo-endopeptidase [Lachnospiraceae bacterium]|nr:ImmA/IrrE family metallo-endopeptidase [uncultured Acetatifactor sp.]MCI8286906.1 ImmA/IrrE family metallo-endopeptidase [Lachnospiraceae bacterium]